MEIEMTTFLQKTAVLVLAVVMVPAWAAHDQEIVEPSVATPAADSVQYEQAEVLDVQPITAIVRTPQEQQVCRE